MKLRFLPLVFLVWLTPAHGQAPTPTEQEIEALAAGLWTVTAQFAEMVKDQPSRFPWSGEMKDRGEQNIEPTRLERLTGEFAPLRPFARGGDELYVVNVCRRGDKEQHPVYLYLLSLKDAHARILAGFHFQNGQAQKIEG